MMWAHLLTTYITICLSLLLLHTKHTGCTNFTIKSFTKNHNILVLTGIRFVIYIYTFFAIWLFRDNSKEWCHCINRNLWEILTLFIVCYRANCRYKCRENGVGICKPTVTEENVLAKCILWSDPFFSLFLCSVVAGGMKDTILSALSVTFVWLVLLIQCRFPSLTYTQQKQNTTVALFSVFTFMQQQRQYFMPTLRRHNTQYTLLPWDNLITTCFISSMFAYLC